MLPPVYKRRDELDIIIMKKALGIGEDERI